MIANSTVNVTLCFDRNWRGRIRLILEAVSQICETARGRDAPPEGILGTQSNRK
jgi:hypothetical protein